MTLLAPPWISFQTVPIRCAGGSMAAAESCVTSSGYMGAESANGSGFVRGLIQGSPITASCLHESLGLKPARSQAHGWASAELAEAPRLVLTRTRGAWTTDCRRKNAPRGNPGSPLLAYDQRSRAGLPSRGN